MPAGDASKIRFAPDGALYLAPIGGGLVLPEDVGDGETPPTGFKALGYVDENGVTITPTIETDPVNVWQSATPVLYNVNSAAFQIQATLVETNQLVTETFFGAEWVELLDELSQPTGVFKLDISSTPELQEFAMVVDWKHKNSLYRAVIGRAMVSERGAITLQRTESAKYELTIDALDNGGQLGYLLTNDPMTDTP